MAGAAVLVWSCDEKIYDVYGFLGMDTDTFAKHLTIEVR
jgi:hypothetical protein